MSTSAISQFCQQIPLCEGAKTVLTANPKVALVAAIGVVGITLIARRVLCSTPSESDHTGRILERRGSVIIHELPAEGTAESMKPPDPVEKPSGTFVIHDEDPEDMEEAGADSSMVANRSAEKVQPRLVDKTSALPDKKFHGLKRRQDPPSRSRLSSEKDLLQRSRWSTELVQMGTGLSKRFGTLLSSNIFDTSHGNAPLDFHCLRNSHPCTIAMKECIFRSASVAILAMQFPKHMNKFQRLTIEEAIECAKNNKKLMSNDWADNQVKCMHEVLLAKFSLNRSFKEKLLATGDNYLFYQGSRRDGYQDEEDGNKLGEILMQIRGELGGAGIVERPEEEPPTPPAPPTPKPILKPPGSKHSGVSRVVRWFLPKKN